MLIKKTPSIMASLKVDNFCRTVDSFLVSEWKGRKIKLLSHVVLSVAIAQGISYSLFGKTIVKVVVLSASIIHSVLCVSYQLILRIGKNRIKSLFQKIIVFDLKPALENWKCKALMISLIIRRHLILRKNKKDLALLQKIALTPLTSFGKLNKDAQANVCTRLLEGVKLLQNEEALKKLCKIAESFDQLNDNTKAHVCRGLRYGVLLLQNEDALKKLLAISESFETLNEHVKTNVCYGLAIGVSLLKNEDALKKLLAISESFETLKDDVKTNVCIGLADGVELLQNEDALKKLCKIAESFETLNEHVKTNVCHGLRYGVQLLQNEDALEKLCAISESFDQLSERAKTNLCDGLRYGVSLLKNEDALEKLCKIAESFETLKDDVKTNVCIGLADGVELLQNEDALKKLCKIAESFETLNEHVKTNVCRGLRYGVQLLQNEDALEKLLEIAKSFDQLSENAKANVCIGLACGAIFFKNQEANHLISLIKDDSNILQSPSVYNSIYLALWWKKNIHGKEVNFELDERFKEYPHTGVPIDLIPLEDIKKAIKVAFAKDNSKIKKLFYSSLVNTIKHRINLRSNTNEILPLVSAFSENSTDIHPWVSCCKAILEKEQISHEVFSLICKNQQLQKETSFYLNQVFNPEEVQNFFKHCFILFRQLRNNEASLEKIFQPLTIEIPYKINKINSSDWDTLHARLVSFCEMERLDTELIKTFWEKISQTAEHKNLCTRDLIRSRVQAIIDLITNDSSTKDTKTSIINEMIAASTDCQDAVSYCLINWN